MEVAHEGVTAPIGFQAAGVNCGIKKLRKDVALVVSATPAVTAAMFTTNSVVAAPVVVGREQMAAGGMVRAIVVNSGNANACTGERGLEDAWAMVEGTAAALRIDEGEVLVASTGVIGQYLPMENIQRGIRQAAELLGDDGTAAAEAIRTTDTFAKESAVRCVVDGVRVTVGGMAKGSGMIAPNMATMLAFVTTDAAVTPAVLQAATRQAVDRSFHRISVDGDTSTNDMVAVMANGMAGNPVITATEGPGYEAFYMALEHVLVTLAKMIVMDGEGATKFVEIRVTGAPDEAAGGAGGAHRGQLEPGEDRAQRRGRQLGAHPGGAGAFGCGVRRRAGGDRLRRRAHPAAGLPPRFLRGGGERGSLAPRDRHLDQAEPGRRVGVLLDLRPVEGIRRHQRQLQDVSQR
jgi:glutamate N-acetyltransferase/amino-acid N-acetyltransferase